MTERERQFNLRIDTLESMLSEVLAILRGGSFSAHNANIKANGYTLHAWLDEWLQTFKAPNVKPNTLYTLEVAIRVHIKPNLPDMALPLISGLELQKFLTRLADKTRTRKTVYDVLKGAFRDAIGLKLILDNPMTAVKIPAHNRKRGANLDNKELIAFKKAIKGHHLEPLFLFLLYSGCRRGEALALKNSDIDFKNKLLHIPGTKTKLSDRTIPLFENLADLLVKITPDKDGCYFRIDPRWATRVFKRFCPAHKLHDLRHTFATNCLNAKIPLKVVQTWLGHAEIDTTADIYSHVTKELNESEAETLNRYLADK